MSNSDANRVETTNATLDRLSANAIENQSSYAKWLLASLITVNGGAIIALAQIEERAHGVLSSAGAFFFISLVVALLTGGATWLNFTYASLAYIRLRANGVTDRQGTHYFGLARILARVAILFAFVSLAAFAAGGWSSWKVLVRPETCFGLKGEFFVSLCKVSDRARLK